MTGILTTPSLDFQWYESAIWRQKKGRASALLRVPCPFDHSGVPKVFFVDHASVKVIARAALETYLVFFYLYGNSDRSLSEFRHKTWRLGGLADRQKYHTSTEQGREVLARDPAQ